ncbi:TIGR03016 family PEP-CTERM system-associated outer membrane protein [Oxalobacteraceae sp. CFBP 8753]|nr:TIGR03016 family PEP-CTERM system-associated outer membrane protein [Oxalobacteraceae sp. CFBP 8753]
MPRLVPLAAAAMLLAAFPAHAQWTVTPTLVVSETWTDNVNLTEDALAHSDLITQVSPGITVLKRGPRLTVDATAQLHGFAYLRDNDQRDLSEPGVIGQNFSTSNTQRSYRGNLRGEVLRELFFVEANASRGQQNISPFGPRAGNDMYSNRNRTEIDTWSVSPYLTHRFGSFASGVLRYTRDSVNGGDSLGFRNTGGDTLLATLSSGTGFRTVGWGATYLKEELDGALYGDSSTEKLIGNLRYRLNQRLSLLANAGYERYRYEGLGDGDQGANWSVGFAWSPSLRTSVQATLGRHFQGTTGTLSALHRSRHSTWNISYNDEVTTSRQQFLLPSTIDTAGLLNSMFATAYPDPLERQRIVAAYIAANGLPPSLTDSINYLSNRFMRQKSLRASAGYRKGLSNAVVLVYATDRSALSEQQSDSALLGSQQGRLNDNVRQHGLAASYTYRLSSRSNLTAGYDFSQSESRSGGYEDQQRMLRLGVSRRFGDLLAAVDLRRRTGNVGRFNSSNNGGTFTEHAMVATLSMKF